jgi:hypothetical protein
VRARFCFVRSGPQQLRCVHSWILFKRERLDSVRVLRDRSIFYEWRLDVLALCARPFQRAGSLVLVQFVRARVFFGDGRQCVHSLRGRKFRERWRKRVRKLFDRLLFERGRRRRLRGLQRRLVSGHDCRDRLPYMHGCVL